MAISNELVLDSLSSLSTVVSLLFKYSLGAKIWVFEGDLGGGKTTIIKQICKHLNVIDTVNSPTYSIVNEYLTATNDHIYHFDLYRLNSIREVVDIGFEDYLYSNNYCFIEWPEIAYSMLPDNFFSIKIDVVKHNNSRILYFSHKNANLP